MLEVTLVERRGTERISKDRISFKKPNTYKELEEEIRTKLNLVGKEIAIQIDGDKNIKDEETYADEESLKYIVLINMDEENNSNYNSDLPLNIDEIFNIKKDLELYENEFKEMINKNIDIELNKEEVKIEDDKIEKDSNLFDLFFEKFQKDISSKTESKKKSFIESIKKDLSTFDTIINEKIDDIKRNVTNNLSFTKDVKKSMEGFSEGIKELRKKENAQIVVEDKARIDDKKENKVEEQKREEPKEEKLPIMFSISLEKKDYEIFSNETDDIKIEDIIIKNILDKNISLENLKWVKEANSNQEINFLPNDKLNIKGDLEGNEEKKASINLNIENPEKDKTYTLVFSISAKPKNKDLYQNVTQKPLAINIIVKEKVLEPEEEKKPEPEEEKKPEPEQEEKPEPKEEKQPEPEEEKKPEPEEEEKPEPEEEKQPEPEPNELDVEKIYQKYEEEYYISGFIDEEEFKEEARRCNGDDEHLKKYVEERV